MPEGINHIKGILMDYFFEGALKMIYVNALWNIHIWKMCVVLELKS